MTVPYGWEGRLSYWPCVTYFSGLSTYGLNGLWKGDEHPAYTPLRSVAPFTFTAYHCCWWCLCTSFNRGH